MNFDNDVINASRQISVLAVFSTSWCGPCRQLKSALSANSREDVEYVYIDVDHHQPLATKYQVRSVPTLLLFNIGKQIARINGSMSGVQLNNWLDSVLPQPWTEVR